MSHIGTLREKPLHASLKEWCSLPGDRFEVPVDGFVIDVVRDGLLIEIQTRGFSSMKKKLTALLDEGHRVRIVHPVAVDTWIVKLGDGGELLSRRRSPKHGMVTDIVSELVSFPELLGDPNLEVQVCLVEQDEIREHSDDGPWRRKGWRVTERRLVEVIDDVLLESAADLVGLLPEGLPEPFTTADIATGLGRRRRVAQQLAYCLRKMDAITEIGRKGNAVQYRVI
ncbi:MAG: hypothetical protein KJO84_01915 [Acidimicrobiia bacterium]|nr:hypothetical protein [Acidimicrobiia bacterium]